MVLELERFFPDFRCCLSKRFLKEYSKQKDQLVLRKSRFSWMKDVLSKTTIWSSMDERDEDGGSEGTIDKVAEKQRELGAVVRGLASQLDLLLEETSELKDMIAKIETKKVGLGAKYKGSKIVSDFDSKVASKL